MTKLEAGQPEAAAAETAKPQAEEAKPQAESEEPPARYKPLDDDLRAEIRETLARQQAREPAQEKLREAMDQVRQVVDRYGRELTLAEALEEREAPEPLDLTALVEQYGLGFGQTPKWDALDITLIRQADPTDDDPAAYELARATETVWSQSGQFRRSLADVAYRTEMAKYIPREFTDGIVMPGAFPVPPQKLFLYWRVEQQPEKTPELEEVRSEVVEAWKLQQALPLAETKAEALAEEARGKGGRLAEAFPESASQVITTMQFSWMTRGSMPGGTGGRPMLSPVNGTAGGQPVNIAGAGNEFMRSVFSLDVGQVGVATNEPHTFVYVVRINSEDLSDEQRREAFYTTGLTPDINNLVEAEQMEVISDWFNSLEDRYDVDWKRESQESWNRQQ